MLKKVLSLAFIFSLLFSFIGLKVEASDNVTDLIKIVINQKTDTKIDASYYIVENFKVSSRGVFLALPKNQSGVWTDYNLKSVQRTIFPINNIDNNPIYSFAPPESPNSNFEIDHKKNTINLINSDSPEPLALDFQKEPYDEIKEWNQIRFRIGQKDRYLPVGVFVYKIDLEISLNPSYKYDLTLLQDWTETVNRIEVIENNQDLCVSKISCSGNSTKIAMFETKPESPIYGVFFSFAPYLLILVIISILTYYLWHIFAKDPMENLIVDKPEFESPNLKPWEADYLIKEGGITVKDTLLSYILWLNTNKYISYKPDSETSSLEIEKRELKVKILKDLPEILPEIFNKTVHEIANLGMKEGVLASKINEAEAAKLNENISNNLSKYYAQKPIHEAWVWVCVIAFVVFFVWSFVVDFVKQTFLVGDSYWNLAIFGLISLVIPAILVLNQWGKVNLEGAKLRAYCMRYKYYIQKVETLKLDFSNNPNEGVQYYLKAVAFAASFGLLTQFGKYFQKLVPNSSDIEDSNTLRYSYAAVSFYVPPSDSSGGGGFSGGGFSGGGGSW